MKHVLLILMTISLSGCFLPECSEIVGKIDQECMPTEMLSLDSGGGGVYFAIEIANKTQNTHVFGECSSACVLIASRGENRSACHDSIFGLHTATTDIAQRKSLEFYTQDERVNDNWVNFWIEQTPTNDMYEFSAYVAKHVGLIDEVVNCD